MTPFLTEIRLKLNFQNKASLLEYTFCVHFALERNERNIEKKDIKKFCSKMHDARNKKALKWKEKTKLQSM